MTGTGPSDGGPPLAPIDVARLEEGRLAQALRETSAEHTPFAGGVVTFGGPGSWQNVATGAGLSAPVAPAEVERFCAFLRARGAEPRIELCPFADPSLTAALAERGFVITRFEDVLYRPLEPGDDYRALLPRGWPEDEAGHPLEVRRIDPSSDAELALLADVSGSGFRSEGTAPSVVDLEVAARTARSPRVESFVASFGDVPAAAASVDAFPGVSALFGLSTLPAFRRRGVQLALLAVRLERARALGSRIATIGSLPGAATERNALRMGFRIAYTKVLLRRPEPGLTGAPV